jgi:hypothetical protein
MTSGPHTVTAATTAPTAEEHALRLRLKPKGPTTGYVDGAWWPRSADLVGELPELFAVLAVRLRSQRAGTVTVIGASDRHRVTLLTVPSDTDPDVAHDVQMTAAHRDNTDTVETLRDRLK